MSNDLTMFKRGLMRALLDEKDCLTKLSKIANEISLSAFKHEESAKRRRIEQKEVEELILFLQEDFLEVIK